MKKSKWLCLLLTLTMMITCIPVGLFAEGEDSNIEIVEVPVEVIEQASVEETVEETTSVVEEQPVTVEETPVVEEVSSDEENPVVEEEQEEPASPAIEANDEEPVAEEEQSVDENASVEDAFVASLATLSVGDVFADEKLKDKAGFVKKEAVVYAIARVSGEGELLKNDVIRIIANVDGQATTLYVKNGRLNYLNEEQIAAYMNDKHDECISFRGVKLDALLFESAVIEEIVVDEIVEVETADTVVFEIITEPQDVEGAAGDSFTFTVEATGVASYQWQYSSNGGTNWYNTSWTGAKTATLTTPAMAENRMGWIFHCILTDAEGVQHTTRSVAILSSSFVVDNVQYHLIDQTSAYVERYLGTASNVVIPETVNGYTVTQIGQSAFEGNTNIVSIDLPDTITIIGKRAFAGCTNLSEMK